MRHATLLCLLLAGALSVVLFSVKYQVQDLEDEMSGLNKSIHDERQSIRVLKAEWSHLNNPERLSGLARRYLGMEQSDTSAMIGFRDIERLDQDLAVPTAADEGGLRQ